MNIRILALLTLTCTATQADAPNALKIVVANGPNAGTYQAPADEVLCMHAKSRNIFSTAWKGFEKPKDKAMEEAGMEISDPDSAKPKLGYARVAFFGADGKKVVYQTVRSPVTLTMSGKTGQISYDGKTTDGVNVKLTASCMDVEYL